MNEDSLLALIRKELPIHDPSVIVESGDDCAIVKSSEKGKSLVLKTDATIEGIHFTTEAPLADVGWKALCRCISDFGAMGAIPQHALITAAAPAFWKETAWLQLCCGIGQAARTFGITIVGGEITQSPGGLFLSITLTGYTGMRSLLRKGAMPGHLICVTGQLGGSLKSGRHFHFMPRLLEGQWLAAQPSVQAMMDLSDGLGSDLPRLARVSQCSFSLQSEKIPLHDHCTIQEAISDGEDYELLLTVDSKAWLDLHAAWEKKFPNLKLTSIGMMTSPSQPSTALLSGYDHLT